jgi:hypothetical protein
MEQAMRSLQFPNARVVIEDALDVLGDTGLQQRVWVEQKPGSSTEYPSFRDAINWLFDDSGLGDGVDTCIGYMLYDELEARGLKELMNLLDILLKRYGSQLSSATYFNSQEWPLIAARARDCLTLFRDNDQQ